ncbi:selenoprotein F [Cimex lectularius]|uniref:Selenoprotein F n=1 Tax=Cimex lectularius TaxID=79782 RepID=A0A8I6TE36_CIMLE|nr:selenoprotein F [Cimex lectularius]
MSKLGFTLFFCSLAALFTQGVLGEFTAEDCWALGFNKATLLCSSCEHLKKYDLEEMREHCFNCCNKDEHEPSVKRYPKATLEVCTCKFGAYPQIQAFVKGDKPSKFPNLTIRYVRGLDPIIKLFDHNGNVQEVLAIERWDTDAVDEFLKTHLEPVTKDDPYYLKTNQI